MKTRHEIEITQGECDAGIQGNAYQCVVVAAIQRCVPFATRVVVDAQAIRFTLEEDGKRFRLVYLTPPGVRDYVIAFDAGEPFKPMKFAIDKPQIEEKTLRSQKTAKRISFKEGVKKAAIRKPSTRVFGERNFRVNQATN